MTPERFSLGEKIKVVVGVVVFVGPWVFWMSGGLQPWIAWLPSTNFERLAGLVAWSLILLVLVAPPALLIQWLFKVGRFRPENLQQPQPNGQGDGQDQSA